MIDQVLSGQLTKQLIQHLDCSQGLSKHGLRMRTFGIFYEDCYAQDILRFVCNICLR